MGRRRRNPIAASIDEAALAEFRAALRRRYSDAEILQELRESAQRLGRSPTMREFAADGATRVHPQTVIEHFGTWNAAKRAAGLVPRRFVTRDELLVEQGVAMARRLGRLPRMEDWKHARRADPSLLSEWQVYRLLDLTPPWSAFQFLVRERLRAEGVDVRADGNLAP